MFHSTHPHYARAALFVFVVMILVSSFAVLSVGVSSAQNIPVNATVGVENSNETQFDPTEEQRIDDDLVLLHAEYRDGQSILRFKVESPTSVTLTDASAFAQGGRLRTRTSVLQPGEHTLRFPTTQYRGRAGVTVSTKDVIYAVPLRTGSSIISGPWSSGDVQIAAIAGASTVAVMSLLITFRTLLGKRDSPERIA